MVKNFTTQGSRLERYANNTSHKEASIAGRKVSLTEEELEKTPPAKKELVKTSIKIDKALKEKTMALANLKQMTWIGLIEKALENQLRANAKMMNQFTKYHIEETESNKE